MGGKTAIVLGVAAGLVVGGLIVGGAIALVPVAPSVAPSATPAPAASPAPSATVGPSAPPSSGVSPSPVSPSPVSSSAPSESPSEASPAEAFGIGESASPLVLPLAGGGTVDLADYRCKPVWVHFMATWCPSCVDDAALGGIGPDVMAQGLGTILPGVTVTP
jgi:hypothetical protein